MFIAYKSAVGIESFNRGRVAVPIQRSFHVRGFTFVGLLILIALLGLQLGVAGSVWKTSVRRDKEAELLFVGSQFRAAIQSYYLLSPGQKRYPRSLEEMLLDSRFPETVRHLRRIYRDPVMGGTEWGLIPAPDGGIMGIHSLSQEKPFKTGNFPRGYEDFTDKQSYREWIFSYGETANPATQAGPTVQSDTAVKK